MTTLEQIDAAKDTCLDLWGGDTPDPIWSALESAKSDLIRLQAIVAERDELREAVKASLVEIGVHSDELCGEEGCFACYLIKALAKGKSV